MLTPTERKALGAYIRWCANELGLRDWTVVLMDAPVDNVHDTNPGGKVEVLTGRKRALIWVSADFRGFDAELQRHTIVHELLHIHLEGTRFLIRELLWDARLLNQETYQAIALAHQNQVELAVDGITESVAKYLPLVKWPKGR